MNKEELIKRYIYAVTKRLKPENRTDIGNELNSIIEDMLTERCGDMEPSMEMVRSVLEELGTPAKLAEKYDENKDTCLIGPPYYSMYLSILKLVAACVVFGLLLANVILGITDQIVWYKLIFKTFAEIVGGLFTAFAFVTLIFAFLHRKGIKMDELYGSISNLPPVPQNQKLISKREAIGGIVISVLFLIVFLLCPQIVFIVTPDHSFVPIFNAAFIHQTWYFLVLFSFLGISRDSVKLSEGMYNSRLCIATVIFDLFSAFFTVLWMRSDELINPAFSASVHTLFAGETTFITYAFEHFNVFFMVLILFALFLDILVTIIKTLSK